MYEDWTPTDTDVTGRWPRAWGWPGNNYHRIAEDEGKTG